MASDDLAIELETIANALIGEAAIADRPGQMTRLEQLAADVRGIAAALPVPVPPVDRDALVSSAHDAVPWHTLVGPGRVRSTEIVARVIDHVLSRGAAVGQRDGEGPARPAPSDLQAGPELAAPDDHLMIGDECEAETDEGWLPATIHGVKVSGDDELSVELLVEFEDGTTALRFEHQLRRPVSGPDHTTEGDNDAR